MLRHLSAASHPDLLVGADTSDDAAVWRLRDDLLLVSSTDFFAPIVDDARTWGAIAAANAASDIYAMGADPLFALNVAAWPRDVLPLELLAEVLAGGADTAAGGGWVVAGGHTVDGPEPLYGMSVSGICTAGRDGAGLLTNAGGRPGQALVLTKPLGTGLLATALKHSEPQATAPGGALWETYEAGVAEMCRLNAAAARCAVAAGATAATDVTGFGLLGHLGELAAASGVSATVDASAVPLLPGVAPLAAAGFEPAGTQRNLDYLDGRPDTRLDGPPDSRLDDPPDSRLDGPPDSRLDGPPDSRLDGGDPLTRVVLADPQTSGGLLFSCSGDRAASAAAQLRDSGHSTAVIGELAGGPAGTITIVGAIDGAADATATAPAYQHR